MSQPQTRSRTGQEGFTLIELLVVVLIIGILASIAIPAFLGQKRKAQDMAAKAAVRNGVVAAESFYAENQTFTGMVPALLVLQEQNVIWKAALPALATEDQIFVNTFPVAPAPVQDSYILSSKSQTGTTFVYYRAATGASLKCSGLTDNPSAWAAATPTGCSGAYPNGW